MKKYFLPILMFIFFVASAQVLVAQNDVHEKVDVLPTPVGGMIAIAKNVVYPESAKKNKIEGKVLLTTVIDISGNPTDIKILKSVGHGCDEAAINAVKKTKFKPGLLNGKPVATKVTIPLMFKLK